MATFPLPTLAPTITGAGISVPTYADILSSLQASVRQIYGEDIYVEPDSMDGQLLAIMAQAIYDCGQTAVAVYNSFSPQTAFGAGLSSVVKINHLARAIATNSQVNVTITGVAGTTIVNGVVGDVESNQWLLPTSVTIPPGGTLLVTATAKEVGAIQAVIGSVTKIITPTAGWQSVTNLTAASPGQPVESDAELRARQIISPALNSNTVLSGLAAAIKALPGVVYGTIYENDTGTTDTNGLPAHSIAAVVQGGVAADIAQTLYNRKAPGVATHGTTTAVVTDVSGADRDIKFFIPTEKPTKVEVSLYPGGGYTTVIADAIKAAIVNHINALSIGEDVIVTRLLVPAMLAGLQDNESYRLTQVRAAFVGGSFGSTDLTIAFTEKATAVLADITIIVL